MFLFWGTAVAFSSSKEEKGWCLVRRLAVILTGYALLLAGVLAGQQPTWRPREPKDLASLQTALHTEGVAYSSVDYSAEQVVFGVRTREAKERIQRQMRRMHLKPEVVRFEPESGLLSEVRPLEGCQLTNPPRPDIGSPYLALSLETAPPGTDLTFTIVDEPAADVTRGVDSYLECWDGQGWSPRFILFTDVHGGPSSLVYGTVAIISLGLPGTGPEVVRLPDQLHPGWYRLRKGYVTGGGETLRQRTGLAYLQVRYE